jgi:hypothetical protein
MLLQQLSQSKQLHCHVTLYAAQVSCYVQLLQPQQQWLQALQL